MEKNNIEKALDEMVAKEEKACLNTLSLFVQEEIVPVDPVYVIGKLATIDKAIIWYIEKLKAEIETLKNK